MRDESGRPVTKTVRLRVHSSLSRVVQENQFVNITQDGDTKHYPCPKEPLTDAAMLLPDPSTANPEKGYSNVFQGTREVCKVIIA